VAIPAALHSELVTPGQELKDAAKADEGSQNQDQEDDEKVHG